MKKYKYPVVLTIAGFDSSGGAGLQADIKTISALGCYATCVLTSLPIQNTRGVRKIYPVPVDAVGEQIAVVMDDIFPDAIKIGMVHSSELADIIAGKLRQYPKVPVVFDPVMVASSGDRLIKDEDIDSIIEMLFPLADLITPNMDEAAVLAKMKVATVEDMLAAGRRIRRLNCHSVLLKGGHQQTDMLTSCMIDEENNFHEFKTTRIRSNNTHGSGCTLSSAIAAYLALGKNLYDAVALGQQYVFNAIDQGKDVITGKGTGPLNHFFNPQKLFKYEMV